MRTGVLGRNVFCYPRSKNKSVTEPVEQTSNSEKLLCTRTCTDSHPIL